MSVTVRDQGRRVYGGMDVGVLSVGGLEVWPIVGSGGKTWYVDPVSGKNTNSGRRADKAFLTFQKALDKATDYDAIGVLPGEVTDNDLVIAAAQDHLTVFGLGGRGAAYIKPAGTDKNALTVNAVDVSLINIGLEGKGTGGGLVNSGRRLRAYGCKIEGGALAVDLHARLDDSENDSADVLFQDCEICWSTDGVRLKRGLSGAVTQAKFKNCEFHNLSNASFVESGENPVGIFRGLLVRDCSFMPAEGGTEPTFYFDLNGDNANTGLVTGCRFITELTGGKNLVSTKVLWVGNYHPAGISTGQPS